MKWNSNNVVEFLNVYQQYPVLWNIKDKAYGNTKLKDEIFQRLFTEINEKELIGGMSVKQLKAKIKSIKDVYRQELHKIEKSKKSGYGTKEVYSPKLAWFSEANYLAEVLATRSSKSNLDLSENSEETVPNEGSEETVPNEGSEETGPNEGSEETVPNEGSEETVPNEGSEETVPNEGSEETVSNEGSEETVPNEGSEETVPNEGSESCRESVKSHYDDNYPEERFKNNSPAKIRPPATRMERAASEISVAIHQLDKIAQHAPQEKPYDQFGKFVASELRHLPQRQAILLQQEIQNCIIRSKLSSLEHVTRQDSILHYLKKNRTCPSLST